MNIHELELQVYTTLVEKVREGYSKDELFDMCSSIANSIADGLDRADGTGIYLDNKEALDNAVIEFIHNYGIMKFQARLFPDKRITHVALQFHLTRMLELSVY